jgi:hypothetical protein
MEDKLTYYDIVAHVVPGTLVLAGLAFIPKLFGFTVPWPSSDVLGTAIGVPLAYAVGQVIQGLSSMAQPLYYRFWGGMPSDAMLAGRSKRLKEDRRSRILSALGPYFNCPTETDADRSSLFRDAMALCNREGLGRAGSFNASYAFHRALLTSGAVTTLLMGVPLALHHFGWVSFAPGLRPAVIYSFILSVALTVIEFIRTKQRGEYFAMEVLEMAYTRSREGAAA